MARRALKFKHARVTSRSHRLVASRWPTVGVFDDIASTPEDAKAAFLLESLTNDRNGLLSSRVSMLPDKEIVTGATASIVMAAFLHADETGTRFSDGRLGAWYAALDIDTAIAETVYHHERRLRLSDGAFPAHIQMRELVAHFDVDLVDLRGLRDSRADLYHLTDYSASQAMAAEIRWCENPARGIVYDSVRADGTNVCAFWPSVVPLPVVQGDHYEYRWNSAGERFIARLTELAARR